MAVSTNGIVVMKFGGTSVADAERLISAAKRMVRAREDGHSVVAVLSARGATTDQLVEMAQEISPEPHPREMDMLLSTGRADLVRPVRDGAQRPRQPGDLTVGVAGRHRDRHVTHQGADPGRARGSHPRRPRGRQHRAGGRVPGRLDLARRDDARPRRVRHDGRRAGRCAGGRRLRDLHRRGRCLLRRPAHRARCAQAAHAVVRGDARDVCLGSEGAAAALRGVRAQLRRPDPRAAELR